MSAVDLILMALAVLGMLFAVGFCVVKITDSME